MTISQTESIPLQPHKLLLPLALLFLTACSTLRVDVDVYKGPLINEPKVQKKQLTGMVLGAKPLLRQVDMSLRHDGFKHGNMPELEITAEFVEEILSLYENNKAVQNALAPLKDNQSDAVLKEALKRVIAIAKEGSETQYLSLIHI